MAAARHDTRSRGAARSDSCPRQKTPSTDRSTLQVTASRGNLKIMPPPPQEDFPRVDLRLPVRDIVAIIAPICGAAGLFRLGDSRLLGTVDRRAVVQPMEPVRFCSWLEEWVVTFKIVSNNDTEMTMGKDLADKILRADSFIDAMPKLEGIAPVRMPVRRGDSVELLAPGYDPVTGIYCADTVEFAVDTEVGEAANIFHQLLGEFEFPDGRWTASRSGAVQISAMLSVFCQHLFPIGVIRPMFAYTANQPGSGKSLLVNMAISPVWGHVGSTDFPLNERGYTDNTELRKELASAAQDRRPFVWLDDAPPNISSNPLNRFLTATRHSSRVLGKATGYDEPNVSQVFVTGNMLEITPDLLRRALVCELFVPGEVAGRHFRTEIDAVWLTNPANRAQILGALWCVVRDWIANGSNLHADPAPPGYKAWAEVIGGMVRNFASDPLAVPDLPTSGDVEGAEIRQMICALVNPLIHGEYPAFTVDQVVEMARSLDVLVGIVGVTGDPPIKAPERKKLGRRLAPYRGRHLRDGKGRLFAFGARHQDRGTVYPITWI